MENTDMDGSTLEASLQNQFIQNHFAEAENGPTETNSDLVYGFTGIGAANIGNILETQEYDSMMMGGEPHETVQLHLPLDATNNLAMAPQFDGNFATQYFPDTYSEMQALPVPYTADLPYEDPGGTETDLFGGEFSEAVPIDLPTQEAQEEEAESSDSEKRDKKRRKKKRRDKRKREHREGESKKERKERRKREKALKRKRKEEGLKNSMNSASKRRRRQEEEDEGSEFDVAEVVDEAGDGTILSDAGSSDGGMVQTWQERTRPSNRSKHPRAITRQMQDKAKEYVNVMEEALQKDVERNQAGQPALTRLQVASKIFQEALKPAVKEFVISEGILKVLDGWTDRLPDGSYPNLTLTKKVFEAVLQLQPKIDSLEVFRNLNMGKKVVDVLGPNPLWMVDSELKEKAREIKKRWDTLL
eukprot:Platyproteum_vivax@DN3575_c0_g1_i1.p1